MVFRGIPSVCESVHIARDILLAEAAGCSLPCVPVSTKESVSVVRDAKRAGIHVTAEVCPHHLLLCEDDIPANGYELENEPSVKRERRSGCLIEGLLDGTLISSQPTMPHILRRKKRKAWKQLHSELLD